MIKKINKFINDNRDGIVSAAPIVSSAFGIKQGTVGLIGSAIGSLIPGPAGAAVQVASLFAGTGDHRTVNELTGEIEGDNGTGIIGGIQKLFGWGRSTNNLINKQNRIKTSLADQQLTQDLNYNFYSDPNNSMNGSIFATAAEGGIMRRPVEALVSKGELIYNPMTKKLSKVPGSKGKPNKADDVYARLYEGDVVISNSPTMLMANGKTPALNLERLVDRKPREQEIHTDGFRARTPRMYKSDTLGAREMIIKKVVNWQEANKTKPQEYAKFEGGGIAGINKYGYNKNMSDFAYWDKDKNEYKKEYLDWVNKITEQDVKDIFNGDYGDMSTYKGINPNYIPTVEEARKLMTDKKYGDWHKIGKAVVDKKTTGKKQELLSPQPIKMKITGTTMYQDTHPGNYPIDYEVSPVTVDLKKVANPSLADAAKRVRQKERKQSFKDFLSNTGDIISDSIPMLGAMFGNYDYHTEQPQISSYQYIPTGVSTEPIRRAANESYAMARYNQTNLNPNTGAGMAYGLQAASNRAKTLADAYTWQQDAQNKLIAQNVGIYNDWAKRYDAAKYQAIADTRANEGAAQQMKDSAIRDALEFTQGRRNDRMRLAMMEPLAKYAFDDDTYKKIYSRAIV